MNWPALILWCLGIILMHLALADLFGGRRRHEVDQVACFVIAWLWPLTVIGVLAYGVVVTVKKRLGS